MHCSIVVPALHRWITTPHFYATLWFQRCSGGFQRPALMQHRRSSAALMDSDAPVGFQRHAGGLQRVLLMQDLGSTVAGVFCSDPFFAFSGFNAALADSSDQSIAAPAPHGWAPAPQAYATCVNNDRAPKTQANKCCVAA